MTDLDKLRQLLNAWSVPYHEYDWEPPQRYDTDPQPRHPKLHTLTVGGLEYEWDSEKIEGYSGFYTDFTFTPEGEFVSMGAWE